MWSGRGDVTIERQLHARFDCYRTHGEWFDFGQHRNAVAQIRQAALRLGVAEVQG